jgi:ATP-dependent Clp protease protease subunit
VSTIHLTLRGVKKALLRAHSIAARFRAERAASKPEGTAPLLYVKASADKGELYIYEAIGVDWWNGGGITGKSVKQALDAMKGVSSLDIFINSEGGDVFEAKAIFTQLKRFDAEKVIHIDGIAASAASFIAMAGDKICMSPVATLMIHEAWTVAVGRAEDMRATADLLDLENTTLAETYAKQTGEKVDAMLALMNAETWMSAQEALDQGFIDQIDEGDDAEQADDQQAAAKTPQKIAAVAALAAVTQERIATLSTAQQLAARANVHQPHRASPATQRPASR